MICVAAILAAGFFFKGGSQEDLVDALASQRKLPVIALAARPVSIQPFEIAERLANDPKDFARLVHAKGGYEISVKDGIGMSEGKLSWEGLAPFEYQLDMSDPKPKVIEIPSDALKDGKVTLQSSGNAAFKVKDLSNMPWSKPLTVYWYFARFRFEASVEKATETAFLATLASAIVAQFRSDGTGYHLDLDPKAWRKRAIESAMTDEVPAGLDLPDDVTAAGYRIAVALYRQVSDAQIQHAFDLRDGFVVKDLDGNVMQAVAVKSRLLKDYYDQSIENRRTGDRISLLGMIDWHQPIVGVLLRPMVGAPVFYTGKGGGSVVD